ncbi:hypothetical protein NX059_010307 [Plenodomus lindquistii]|nr:hypothetical protein NX059_010307 [Plenodomus lindquistii]
MRQSPRLAQGNLRQSPDPTGAVAPAPRTPHHPKAGALDQRISTLEAKWHLGLKVNEHRSPAHATTLADKTRRSLHRLFWSSESAFHETLRIFEVTAPSMVQSRRLECLLGIVKNQQTDHSPQTRDSTPASTRNNPPKSLLSVKPTSQPRGRLRGRDSRYDDFESYATAGAPGSPTDEDTDDEFVTPRSQSPSPSCRSSNRRLKASPLVPSRLNDRKRSLDGPDDTGKPTKLTKTLKGKQPVGSAEPIPKQPLFTPIFKKPELPTTRSFPNGQTSFSSVNTSFNTTAASSQETNATSVNTSFTSHGGAAYSDRGPFEDNEREAFVAHKKRETERALSQELNRASNSTFGSVDEALFWDLDHEEEQQLKPADPSAGSTTLVHAGTNRETGTSSNSVEPGPISLTTSFPLPGPSVNYPKLDADVRQRSSSEGPNSRTRLEPQQTVTPGDSPSKPVAYYIRDLAVQNMFVEDLSPEFMEMPFFLLFICCRLSITNKVSMKTLLQQVQDEIIQKDPKLFWSAIGDTVQGSPTESAAVWGATENSFEGFTFKGKVSFSGRSSTSVFKLDLNLIERERSCQFQRMFGSDRFLYLTFPSFSENKPDRFTQDQMPQIEDQWKLWLLREHTFLGRTWRVLHIEPIKRKGSQRKDGKDESADKRVVLFATSGHGITNPMSIGEMLNEFMTLGENQEQNFCKAYARLDLGLSRTIPTLEFKPSQIRRVPDKLSDGSQEAVDFNDKSLDWSERCSKPEVMNDGCARISVGAALRVWEAYRNATGSDEPLPSAFQGRVRGAKGMWMVSAEAHTRDEEHTSIWIEITDSQSKFEPCQDDRNDSSYNRHRLTFNYVQHSFVNGSTDLHISFIPILVNRGVKRDVIAEFMIKHLDVERKQLLEMLTEPVKLHNWVTKQGSTPPASGIVPYEAGLPIALSEKVKLLLRAGFTPQDSPFLAKVFTRFIQQRQSVMEQRLRAPLGSATFLLGLADPMGVLEPGQVHINFSSPFVDEFTRQTYRHLDGLEVLVSRQPACRSSDIQKVRAVAHPKLTHLRDVIVFPTRGEYPLAGKLQGGDYDGDSFWICWENILVEPFKNAPAPLNPPDPARYGIRKDTRKVNQVMDPQDLSTVDEFLKEAFNFRIAPSLLGKATNFLEKLAYMENKISSTRINALCDVHDLLVDAPKQAYQFTNKDFDTLVKFKLRCGKPKIPAYKEAMEASATSREIGEMDKVGKDFKYKPNNILDYLYFDVIRKHNTKTRKMLQNALPKEREDDLVLRFPYEQLRAKNNPALNTELQALLLGLERILQDWNRSLGSKLEIPKDRYSKLLESCYSSFRALNPSNTSDPEIAPLVYRYFGADRPTLWETIRASAIYTRYPMKPTFVWQMAGRELARLKASANPETYNVIPTIFADLKAKPHKVPKFDDEEEVGDEEFESALEKALA